MSILEQVRELPEEGRREVFEFLRNEFEGIPDWQVAVLAERDARLETGESVPVPWEEAKTRLRNLGK